MSTLSKIGQPVETALHRFPLRLRLVAVTVGLLITALAVAGLAASYRLDEYVVRQKSQELHNAAPGVLEQVQERLGQFPSEPLAGSYAGYTVAIMPQGRPPSTAAQGSLPRLPEIDPRHAYVTSHRSFIVRSNDGGSRWLAVAYATDDNSTTLIVAAPLATADRTVSSMRWSIVVISLVAAAISALLGWFLIRRAFRPLRAIEDTATAIAGGDLTRRVPEETTNDEIASLARSLNRMLGRIEESFQVRSASEERMRRFVSDASHELRTPLATVRGYAELYRQGAVTSPKEVAETMSRIEGEAVRMAGLVDDLLMLNRLDRGGQGERAENGGPDRPGQDAEVDLTVVGAEAVQAAQVRDPDRTVRLLSLTGPLGPVPVLGDEAQLHQVLTNLLTNALRYSPAGLPVEVLVGHDVDADGAPTLMVRDHGPGIPADQREQVFERFYRTEASRNSALGGSGLGLAIVRAIVESHHGTVRVRETEGGGATVVVHFPQVSHRPEKVDVQHDEVE